ncbi:hypothetical protein EB796_020921 [Bugula neritina]|uniref:Uncharacterized protein n=1 Tax=Bugula neritina TaxID=10212 RepID=A0A7J7J3T2_BUGNE|nr:hypothetical protein EB796_020921 [Bugula neritina]
MLPFMNDENSMDSVASSNASDNNDDLSRDSQNYVSDSSRSAVNYDNSNSVTPTLSILHPEATSADPNSNSFDQDIPESQT